MTDASSPPDDDPEPQPPSAPDEFECCHSGCTPCIYDIYWDALARYEAALEAWKLRQKSHRA